jgi:glutamate racemase
LSVLGALRAELPHPRFVYVAAAGHARAGEREPGHVIERSQAITRHLIQRHDIQALVVACNTATAAAIGLLRQQHPELPIVGVEPALKPAAQSSQTHRVGVMATRGTLHSAKFQALLASLQGQADFVLQACDGLADAIEHQDAARTEALCQTYTRAMGRFGRGAGEIDTVVLGCTHYPFAADTLRALLGDQVQLVDSGAPVARQTRRVLPHAASTGHAVLHFGTTGRPEQLQAAVDRWVQPGAPVHTLHI